ncbi:16S rRNA (cytidine(1402)-2'-O)-methyltransferase [Stackebrandtia endophytica]|uniref:16S rRNA (cytidine(1402)-2'-O)-methyltransferase n=1 Tax=Stackebrandtia endophytica TaxID=1496996 RepID=UPI001150FE39
MPSTSGDGVLILLGAPLGDPADTSPRVARTLADADVIAAEDTRRLHRLAADLDVTISGTVTSYFEGNERERTPRLLDRLRDGARVAVITDGGMPSVSDPGFRLVKAAIDAGIAVTAAPGPSAVTTALALSGLPCDRFCFEGFLPRKPADRRRTLQQLATEPRTMVLFESTHRIRAAMADLVTHFGPDREAALCRELTKTHEQVRRGTLARLLESVTDQPPRGEITLVVAGSPPVTESAEPADLAAAVADLIAQGVDRKSAMSQTARRFDVPRRAVFDALVAQSDDRNESTDRPI